MQREIGVVVTGQDVAEQQHHPYLGQSGHTGTHDPDSSPCSGLGEIQPWYAQKLGDGILIKAGGLVPPLAVFTLLTLLQNQWVAHELAEGITLKGIH